jgi:hypothetical protein
VWKLTRKKLREEIKLKNKTNIPKQLRTETDIFCLFELLVMWLGTDKENFMGMYTEIHFNSELKKNLPESIVKVLQYMIDGERENEPELPDHEFFKCRRWSSLFRMDSYYFDADTHSTLRFDDISNAYYLCVRANLKNYDSEIQKFINWIMPYLDKSEGEFLGFYRYEGTEEPTLIYAKASAQST